MQRAPNRRRFYIITVIVLVAVLGSALFIFEYLQYSYVSIQVLGNKETSFTVSYDSTTASLSPAQNATVEVLPHANVTITAHVASPYSVVKWDVAGTTFTQKGQNEVNFLTGGGGAVILVSVELTNSSG